MPPHAGRLYGVADLHFAQDVGAVDFRSARADAEPVGQFFRRQAFAHDAHHLVLARSQLW